MGLPSPTQASSGISHYLDRVHSNQEVRDAASPTPGEQRCCEQQAGPGLRVHLIGHASQAASLCTKAANTDSPFLLSSSHGPKLGRLLASFQLQQQDNPLLGTCYAGQYQASCVFSTVELHTAGEPFRIVTSGLPQLPGSTIIERRTWLKHTADSIRTALMLEPRGHADMYGGYLTEPVSASADLGVIFVHNEGYSDHCGHGVIALSTAAVELGWVIPTQPETRVGIDAPCGFIEAFVQWDGRHVGDVRFVNVPSFILHRDVTVTTPSFGQVSGDIEHFTFMLMVQSMGSECVRRVWRS